MKELAQRLVEEHRAAIVRTCDELTQEMGIETEDVSVLSRRLAQLGLVGLGRLRAVWMLNDTSYSPYEQGLALRLFSWLILGVQSIERGIEREARFGEDGLVEFFRDGYATRAMVCSGGGSRTRPMVEEEIHRRYRSMRLQGKAPSFALIAGVEHSPERATPSNIAVETDPDDLITSGEDFHILDASEVRLDPVRALKVIQ